MKVGLFIPCYIDQFYPNVAIATLVLLDKLDNAVDYPLDQTCCDQPLANSGFESDTKIIAENFVENFAGHDYVVVPSGSCALHVKENYTALASDSRYQHIQRHIFELCEFLFDVLKVNNLDASFPYKVSVHQSCHGLRGLRLGSASELNEKTFSKTHSLLKMVEDIDLISLSRNDECCGFGGTFSVMEEAVSVSMGNDRIADHINSGSDVITSADMSCLMHLEGLIKRQGKRIKVMHVAEILNGSQLN